MTLPVVGVCTIFINRQYEITQDLSVILCLKFLNPGDQSKDSILGPTGESSIYWNLFNKLHTNLLIELQSSRSLRSSPAILLDVFHRKSYRSNYNSYVYKFNKKFLIFYIL